MRRSVRGALLLAILLCEAASIAGPASETLSVPGLQRPVRILRDPWGVAHIYAESQRDLFFAQGFNVARDRLFQLEMWRRRATGTMAEIQGRKALPSDIAARLRRFTGDMKEEMAHYHPQGEEIITSFASGINAYIALTEKSPRLLPLELRLLGIRPGRWTPEVVVSRHNALSGNAGDEIRHARLVHLLGSQKAKSLLYLHPGDPDLRVEDGLDPSLIPEDLLKATRAAEFGPEDIADPTHRARGATKRPGLAESPKPGALLGGTRLPQDLGAVSAEGSNNWVVAGKRTLSGRPLLANDPHRVHQVPSLRYWVHLVGPGWNVIGAGEPAVPGVAIGHNESAAWGLTIFPIDQEDLYVYDTNPENPSQYRYRDRWEDMRVVRETIRVKGESPVTVDLKFTRHGPVLREDVQHHKAYALRAAWLETGAAPYLASLRMDQARNWDEFLEACGYYRMPPLNMVWADLQGNIGWQAVGIAPRRKGWNGLLPVPGDGRFEWAGYLAPRDLPQVLNPPEGYVATSNQDNLPPGYPFELGFEWEDPFRFARAAEFLGSGRRLTLADMVRLQQDVVSIPARFLVPLLEGVRPADPRAQGALEMLRSWDGALDPGSAAAAIYKSWDRRLEENVRKLLVPETARDLVAEDSSMKRRIEWLTSPDGRFGADPVAGRDALLRTSLEQAVADLTRRQGPDMGRWRYGREESQQLTIRHPLSGAVEETTRRRLDVGPLTIGGDAWTLNLLEPSGGRAWGPSFRIIADLENWDDSLGTNNPGQSGDPDSPHYRDLSILWAEGKYFPVLYSRDKVQAAAEAVTILEPGR